MGMKTTTIAGLAQAGGVGVETVRYYQRRGLLDQPARPDGGGLGGGVRRYGEADVRRLRFIRAAQAAGFTPGADHRAAGPRRRRRPCPSARPGAGTHRGAG